MVWQGRCRAREEPYQGDLIREVEPRAVQVVGKQRSGAGRRAGAVGVGGGSDLLLNVGVFGVVRRHEGAALRLCYLHLGASGWDLCGPSSISDHHDRLQSQ